MLFRSGLRRRVEVGDGLRDEPGILTVGHRVSVGTLLILLIGLMRGDLMLLLMLLLLLGLLLGMLLRLLMRWLLLTRSTGKKPKRKNSEDS